MEPWNANTTEHHKVLKKSILMYNKVENSKMRSGEHYGFRQESVAANAA